MAEIVRVYKQRVPAMRFIGKNYGDSGCLDWGAAWNDAMSFDIFAKVIKASGGEIKSRALYEDNDAYLSLFYRNTNTGAYDAWIGMFAPIGTEAGEGLGFMDFPEQNLGVCWIYGSQYEVHGAASQCPDKIISAGMEIQSDEHGYIGFFERDQCPRFTTPDDKGNIIIDYCYFVS